MAKCCIHVDIIERRKTHYKYKILLMLCPEAKTLVLSKSQVNSRVYFLRKQNSPW